MGKRIMVNNFENIIKEISKIIADTYSSDGYDYFGWEITTETRSLLKINIYKNIFIFLSVKAYYITFTDELIVKKIYNNIVPVKNEKIDYIFIRKLIENYTKFLNLV